MINYRLKVPTSLAFFILAVVISGCGSGSQQKGIMADHMVLVRGGEFEMGDMYDEGGENERPVHRVRVGDFNLSKYEVTVGDFRKFVKATGYLTSAEHPVDEVAMKKIMSEAMAAGGDKKKLGDLQSQILEFGGAGYWDAEKRQWMGYNPHTDWKNPGFEQNDDHPVVSLSWDDAIKYCNWLSAQEGIPHAYDLQTGEILDADGKPTVDVGTVGGYRLPTEAEWEFAAREGGHSIRFGNGKNVARSSEINFRGDEGDYEFLELGGYAKQTLPVGDFAPNGLGLFDMSGNAWEWMSDTYTRYDDKTVSNPYVTTGNMRILRGGRWGGNAMEIRITHRSAWARNDRCNNSGFRIARSAKR